MSTCRIRELLLILRCALVAGLPRRAVSLPAHVVRRTSLGTSCRPLRNNLRALLPAADDWQKVAISPIVPLARISPGGELGYRTKGPYHFSEYSPMAPCTILDQLERWLYDVTWHQKPVKH